MKKLQEKLKNVPRDAHQVSCSTNSSLNRDQSLSVKSKVLSCNNSDGDLLQHTGGKKLSSNVYVFVLSKDGKPLMPTSPRKARNLLKGEKAHVVKRSPFTIQLNFETTNFTQEITLGIDSGYSHIGFSATSEKDELISGEVTLDEKTQDRLTERRMYRRGRRNKLWYRKPRFMNRVSSKKEGWLPPSILRRYNTHLTLISKIQKLLPITKTITESGSFDIQKIDNPEIQGKGYQEGQLKDYNNSKSYILSREKGKCQICGKEKGGDSFVLHHIIQKSEGGSDKVSNLALLHKKCHEKLHKNGSKMKVKNNKIYKQSIFMNIIQNKFQKDINCEITFGYLTLEKRYNLNLEKSHMNDAFVISGGETQNRCNSFEILQRHRNNRVLQLNRKGFKPSIKRQRYKIQVGDLFWVEGKKYVSTGMITNGKYICFGSTKKKEYFKIEKIEKSFSQGSLIWKQKETKSEENSSLP